MTELERASAPQSPSSLRTWLWCGTIVLLILAGLVDWWYERHKASRFDPQIARVAQQYGVDPALVKAVVWRESKFNPKVRGRVGEIGLMQIRPLTAQEWAQAQDRRRTFDGNLFDPETNLRVGAWYLGKLLKRYVRTDNPVAYALADYNAGRSNVLRWNKGPAETNSAIFLAGMTFPGTQEYVRTILARYAKYQHTFPYASVSGHRTANPVSASALSQIETTEIGTLGSGRSHKL